MADALRKEPEVNVQVVDGSKGEFTVSVNDEIVARKDEQSEMLPTIDEVLSAVRSAKSAAGSPT